MYAVILAGGSGTRFWPLSRETTPKQLLRVFGDTTMIQQTVARLGSSVPVENVYIVTGRKYAYHVKNQVQEVCKSDKFKMLIEPKGRNTAAAVGLAAIHIKKKSPNAVMIVMPSDHIIRNQDEFIKVMKKAEETALKGYLTTIGVVPDRPETGYGYIRKGIVLEKTAGLRSYSVERFVEKPDHKLAAEYMQSGDYLWNSGIFVWRVSDILREIKKQLPDLYHGLVEIEKTLGKKNGQEVLERVFDSLESVSIDYGILENAEKVAVVPADMRWNDVGSWRALDDIAEKDDSGNVITGNVVDVGSKNSIIYAGKRLIATLGLENTVVVDTPDATLICSKDHTQDVRKVVDELKKHGADELVEHTTIERPWGSYTVLEFGSRYKIKRIVVKPGEKLSYQLHHHRSEHWVVVSGTARVTIADKTFNVHPNESTFVPISTKHRLENPGRVPLHLIEVQNGDYIEEDDIVRFDDMYGR